MAFGFKGLPSIFDIQKDGGFIFPVERITARGSKLYRIGLDDLIKSVFGTEVTGSNLDVTTGKTLRIDTAIGTISTGTAYTVLTDIPASSTVTLGIASTVFDFPGTVEATTVTIDNAGAGANPTLTSNDAGQIATLTGSLTVTGDLLISGNTVTNNVATYAVEDNNILLGDGQAVNSETGAGIDIEANGVVTAYIRVQELGPVNTDDAWELKVPDNANPLRLGLNLLTATRTLTAPDASGTIAVLGVLLTAPSIDLTNSTNQIRFDSDAATNTTLSVITPAASRIYTVEDWGSNDFFVGRDFAQTLLNKSLTAPAITGGSAIELSTLSIRDSAAAFDVRLLSTSTAISADRTLTFNIQDADKTLTLSGSATVNQDVSTAGSPTFVALSVSGTDIIMDSDSFSTTLRESATANRVVTIPDFTGTLYIGGGDDVIVADGGTGVSTLADGGLVIGNAAGAVEVVAAGLTTQILVGGGALTAPVWGTDVPTAVTIGGAYVYRAGGTDVELLTGGTGASLAAVNGGIVYSGAAAMAISAAGTSLQVLVSGGAGAPTWSAITMDGASVANTIDIRNGTGLLNIAAASSLDVNANFTVNSAATVGAYANTILNTANEAAFKTAANLESGIDVQAFDATLLSIAALGTAANKALYSTALDTWAEFDITASGRALANVTIAVDQIVYGTGAGTWTTTGLTAAGRSILGGASVAAIATTLGLGTADVVTHASLTATGAANDRVIASVTTDAASVRAAYFEGDRATFGDGDDVYIDLRLSNDAGAQTTMARMKVVASDVSAATEDSTLKFGVITAGAFADEIQLTGAELMPNINDGLALGKVDVSWSDLFLATGSVINWGGGDITLTHAAGSLTFGGDGAVSIDFANNEMLNVDIDSGAIDGTVIGGAVAAAGTFTTLSITSFAADWTNAGRTVADLGIATTFDLNGGTIDGAVIGGAASAAGTFTTANVTTLTAITGVQSSAVARTATVDGTGTGTVAAGTTYVTVTAGADANSIIILPVPVVGNVVWLYIGATGYELRSSDPATIGINGGVGAAAESAIPASTLVRAVCTSATTWVANNISSVGAITATEVAA